MKGFMKYCACVLFFHIDMLLGMMMAVLMYNASPLPPLMWAFGVGVLGMTCIGGMILGYVIVNKTKMAYRRVLGRVPGGAC